MRLYKRYVDVETVIKRDGTVIPSAVYWYNGRQKPQRYAIEKIVDKPEHKASMVGGTGLCYQVVIRGETRKLFLEDGEKRRFFLESMKP
ncbi:MAG: hypothetical protein IKD69_16330 [Solobacterium sp.]|nr:hypothetical protein [Solobacterium sp.]